MWFETVGFAETGKSLLVKVFWRNECLRGLSIFFGGGGGFLLLFVNRSVTLERACQCCNGNWKKEKERLKTTRMFFSICYFNFIPWELMVSLFLSIYSQPYLTFWFHLVLLLFDVPLAIHLLGSMPHLCKFPPWIKYRVWLKVSFRPPS